MKTFVKNIFFLFLLALISCSSTTTSIYTELTGVIVDSTNDRLFMYQPIGEIYVLEASTREDIGDQPVVSLDNDATIFALLPTVVSQMVAYTTSTTTRLFISGIVENSSGTLVTNRIIVLDYNGTSFSEASFSPIILSDGDATTEETDDTFSGLLIDQPNSVLYVTDTTTGLLFAIDADDGTTSAGPFNIGGNPQKMSIDEGRVFICNSSAVAATQLITVLNTTDNSTTTIDVGYPCDKIVVDSSGSDLVMLVKVYDETKVLVRSVNTTTYAASTAIALTGSTQGANGELISGLGLTSSMEDMLLSKDSGGTQFAYLSEYNGNIQRLKFVSGLGEFSLETISTTISSLVDSDILVGSAGAGISGFVVSEAGGLVSFTIGATEFNTDL